jgi:ribonuclease BN (tRNA processing enzyme)/pimeloyl-ACP methyl ester carboxylesterase
MTASGRIRTVVWTMTVLWSLFVSAQSQTPERRATSAPAHGDGGVSDFYRWDGDLPGTPGTPLRDEPVPDHLQLANAAKGVRVLYTSTDGIDGKRMVAVSGAIYFPQGRVPAGGWPVIAWAHGTTGTADVCAPSWMERGLRDTNYLNAWLAQGYAVVASDYQGLGTRGGHPWRSVRPEGWSVLDAVRSALAAFPQLANSVVIVGQSQGAHAALSAAGLANAYAPALRIRATVATGVGGYPRSQWPPQRTSTSLFLVLHKLQAFDPAFQPSDYLTDAGKQAFAAAARSCVRPGETVPLNDVLKVWPESATVEAAEEWPTLRFSHPVFVGIGLADSATPPHAQYSTATAACRAGSIVETHYYPDKDHGGAVNASLVDSVPFVKKALAGASIAGNCATLGAPPVAQESTQGNSTLKVLLLGTRSGPAIDPQRAGIGTLIVAGPERLLFDVGRGVPTAISRMGVVPADVTKVFLTHLHSDHVIDLPELYLFPWASQGRKTPLELWGPVGTKAMMQNLQKAFAYDVHVRRDVDEKFPASGIEAVATDIREGVVYRANGVTVTAFLVDHEPITPAFGYRIDYRGRSVVLSGDTRPSKNLVKFATGADVLIHEVGARSKQDPIFDGPPDELLPNSRATRRLAKTILDHHTDPLEAGTIFGLVKPKLALFSHYPGGASTILPLVRQTYAGPLEFGEDGMTIDVGETIDIRR